MTGMLHSAQQAADLLGVHVRTVHRYIRDGELDAARIGNRYRISTEALEAFAGTAIGEADAAPYRRVEASCVLDMKAMTDEDAGRLTTLLMSAANGAPEGDTRLRLDVSHDPRAQQAKVVVSGGLTHVSAVLALVATFTEQ